MQEQSFQGSEGSLNPRKLRADIPSDLVKSLFDITLCYLSLTENPLDGHLSYSNYLHPSLIDPAVLDPDVFTVGTNGFPGTSS
jgi:hypothetical protein